MGVVAKLALADLRRRPGRLVLTSLAIVASAASVVWVVAGYDALQEKVREVGDEYLGRYDAVVSAPALDDELLTALRADADVLEVEPVLQLRATISGPKGTSPDEPIEDDGGAPEGDSYGGEGAYLDGDGSARGRHVHERPPVLVSTAAAAPPWGLVEGGGAWLGDSPATGVVSAKLAARLGAEVGGELTVRLGDGEPQVVKVVGIALETRAAMYTGETVAGPRGGRLDRRGAGPAGAALYVRPATLALLAPGAARAPNLASIALRAAADPRAFRARVAGRLIDSGAQLVDKDDLREAMNQAAATNAARTQALAATGISLLAACFIIFSTLSMGVSERTRQLAVLRAVALTRAQVARLIAVEALVLALLGWLGGLLAGQGLLAVAAWSKPDLFTRGAGPGTFAVLLSGVGAFSGALLAAIGPGWTASRIDVVAALAARPAGSDRSWVWKAGLAGLGLVSLSPLLLEVAPLPDRPRMVLFGVLGCPALAAGCLLLCPALIVLVERLLGPVLALVLGVPAQLLRSQLASNLARTVGTTAALTIGLGLFITIQVWGYSMLGPFLPGAWAPDALVSISTCITTDEVVRARALPGVLRLDALAVEQVRLADDITGSRSKGESVVRQDNVILLGLDDVRPEDPAARGDLFALTFVEGSRDEAFARLAQGGHVIVPDHFVRTTGVGLGQTFKVIHPADPMQTLQYTIAGVVSLPGWHFVTKDAGLRRRFPRAAALLFTGLDGLRRDYALSADRVDLLGFQLAPGTDEAALRAGLAPIVIPHLARKTPGDGLSIMTPGRVGGDLQARTDGILWGASQLPLITLLVTSLGVVNAIVASVRARRWELGVLRAIGVTRSTLVRMVLAEAILVGVVACALSLAFGFGASWSGVAVAQYLSFFGGLAPPMVVPWRPLLGGVGATLGLCLLAGLWPAAAIGRADTLELLQGGRSA